jgi:Peptidase family M23/Peptidase family M23 N-terminal domain
MKMHQKFTFIIIIITFICLGITPSYASYLPKVEPVPGGIVQIPVDIQTKPIIEYQEHRVLVVADEGENHSWLAIVGIPLTIQPGQEVIQIKHPRFIKAFFQVDEKTYPVTDSEVESACSQPIFIDEMKQLNKENGYNNGIFSYWSDTNPFKKKYILPLQGDILCGFGVHCRIHGSIESCHQGIDLAANKGTAVKAVAPGVVLAVESQLDSGDIVVIDHGQGVISIYENLQDLQVKPKQYVAQGKTIGTVFQGGADQIPYIHWGMVLNQVKVNPLLFVEEKNIDVEPKKAKGFSFSISFIV